MCPDTNGGAGAGAAQPDHENGAEKPLCPSRPQSIPKVDRCAALAGATVSVVFDGWNTFVSRTGSWPSSATKSSTPTSMRAPILT